MSKVDVLQVTWGPVVREGVARLGMSSCFCFRQSGSHLISCIYQGPLGNFCIEKIKEKKKSPACLKNV